MQDPVSTQEVQVVRGMPEAEYRARPELSQSDYKHFFNTTAAHAKYAMEQPHEDKLEWLNGTALHALVLDRRVVYEIDHKCKTQKNPPQPSKGILLSPHNAAIVHGMADGIRRNKGAMAILESLSDTELSIFWSGNKARLDGVFPLGVVDLKNTRGADAHQFSRFILDYGYHIQAAHYLEAAAVAGLPADDFFFIAVENFAPFECAVYKIGHQSLEIGRRELDTLKARYLACQQTGIYPGYSPEPIEINLPAWKLRQEEEI